MADHLAQLASHAHYCRVAFDAVAAFDADSVDSGSCAHYFHSIGDDVDVA